MARELEARAEKERASRPDAAPAGARTPGVQVRTSADVITCQSCGTVYSAHLVVCTKCKTPPPTKVTAKEWLGCLGLLVLGICLASAAYDSWFPGRGSHLQPAVRETRNKDEARIRERIERAHRSVHWRGDEAKDLQPDKVGDEARAGVSLYNFCNGTGRKLTLYLDGQDIFQVDVDPDASVAVELRSGPYDNYVVAHGMGDDNTVLRAVYRRLTLTGTYHDALATSGVPGRRCPGQHELVRQVR